MTATLPGALVLLSTVESVAPTTDRHPVPNSAVVAESTIAPEQKSASFDRLGIEELRVVKKYARESGLDYRLILAIMKQESQFDYDAVSSRGAEGLMQLMPVTNAEVSDKLNLEGDHCPEENIRAGVYYFAQLFDLFSDYPETDRLSLALAAYNAGPARIYDAQELAAYMDDNPRSWQSIQTILPLLSKRFYSLHQAVWADGRPRSGYFGSYRQTVLYVESTLTIYREYERTLE